MPIPPSFPRILACAGLAGAAVFFVLPPAAAEGAVAAAAPVRFGRDIRPILSDRCFKCHGPDPASRQEDLRLDAFEFATADRGGYAAIVPGDAEASELWSRLTAHDDDEVMPPPDSNKKRLSAEELELVRRWIEDGAHYEPHWAFVAPTRPMPPPVRNAAWSRNELDRFVLAQLESAGLAPSPEAEPATLLRRVFLDLTGLPPTPTELAEFLADARPDAYERWVEKLLHEEPYVSRYAERMATPWLDAARYADTSGIHMDAGRQIWPWRDWVLRAFRDGMPFDRFVLEQLAGDLLPGATLDQIVASGFNRNHVTTDEGGAIDEEYRVEYAVDRTNTTGSVFLGLTVGCARCHEHKFDPISQEEYYRLYAFFNSVEEPGIYSQIPDANRALEPFLAVPSAEQEARLEEMRTLLAETRARLDHPAPEDDLRYAEFMEQAAHQAGVAWAPSATTGAASAAGATLTVQPDGSVLASGANPARDEHVLTLRTEATGLRLLHLEALQDPSLPHGRVGRAPNGNAVLSAITVEAVSVRDPSRRVAVPLTWAWADHEQPNGDFDVTNVLDPSPARVWAVNAHEVAGGRNALFLAAEPIGFPGGTEVRVTLSYASVYDEHVLGRVRVRLGAISAAGLEALPVADTRWYGTWPYQEAEIRAAYDKSYGPESDPTLDFDKKYAPDSYSWVFVPALADARANLELPAGPSVAFAGKRLFAPTARTLQVAVGSDDGVQVHLDGERRFENRVDRGITLDQDRFDLAVPAGAHALVVKVVNTGGPGAYSWRAAPREGELSGDLVWALVDEDARARGAGGLADRMRRAWRLERSPEFRALTEEVARLEREIQAEEARIPRTMVMKEAAQQRATYLLMRGQYDKPDTSRTIARGVPDALGRLPEGAPANRIGLVQWLTAADNPLVARVTVNRLWEMVFGLGLVATSEDFGLQGEWPSHPELLDWLAVEFREGGWDVKAMMRRLVTSATYRQSSRAQPAARAVDPENRLLANYPRRRLGAEEVRDQALYVAGLLVEKFGGPSVKPYQPEGLWQEVAMLQSNTREYVRGQGDELWRRSLYTYWKRACPPPSLLTFDAPTREFCNVRRSTTNTPLQALVLWNDEQFVEAARNFAQRLLTEGGGESASSGDGPRLTRLHVACTGRVPDAAELARMHEALEAFRARYRAAPADAAALLEVGESPLPMEYDAAELAAWTLIANAVLALDATISRT